MKILMKKNLKRIYASVVATNTTVCSTSIGPQKTKKKLREICKYLKDNRIDRTRFGQKVGDVLVFDMDALRLVMDEKAG